MDAGESKWQFEICDTITNTGPIIAADIGQRASNVSNDGSWLSNLLNSHEQYLTRLSLPFETLTCRNR